MVGGVKKGIPSLLLRKYAGETIKTYNRPTNDTRQISEENIVSCCVLLNVAIVITISVQQSANDDPF